MVVYGIRIPRKSDYFCVGVFVDMSAWVWENVHQLKVFIPRKLNKKKKIEKYNLKEKTAKLVYNH